VVRTSQTEPLCLQCLLSSLLGKFKAAVDPNKLVRNGDRVLVASSPRPLVARSAPARAGNRSPELCSSPCCGALPPFWAGAVSLHSLCS